MAKPKKLLPWLVCAPTPTIPDLTRDQRNWIAEAAGKAGIDLSADDWRKVELARRDHVWSLSAKRRAIPYKSFEKRLTLIREGVDNIFCGLCGETGTKNGNSVSYPIDTTTILLMKELAENKKSGNSSFELFPLLHSLRTSARRAAERTKHWGEQNAWRFDWHALINLLATVFEDHQVSPTAAKSSRAKKLAPSPFVGFVWNIIQSLPTEYREHVQSQEAMADAVANSLAFRRGKPAGENKVES
jgi:hypothetical protein